MDPIAQLSDLCRAVGDDLLLVQGGGGNGSVKAGNRMWIKASGVRMADVGSGTGHCGLDLAGLRAGQPLPQTPPRPSMEWALHAALGPVVLHTHPVFTNAFACMADGRAALAQALGQEPVWLDYCAPGPELAAGLGRLVAEFQQQNRHLPEHVVLANHGLVASGASVAAVLQTTGRLTRAAQQWFGALPDDALSMQPPDPKLQTWADGLQAALARRGHPQLAVRPAPHVTLTRAAAEPERWLRAGPLVPDDVVFGASGAHVVEPSLPPDNWLESMGNIHTTMLIAVRGLGVVLTASSGGTLRATAENLLAHVLIRRLVARRGEVQPLAPAAVAAILGMEAETYRQSVAAAI